METMPLPDDRFATIGDLSLRYLDWGQPEATPMVLLHGLCGNAHYWDFFARSMKMESDMLSTEVAKTMGGSLAFGSTVDVERAGHSVPGG